MINKVQLMGRLGTDPTNNSDDMTTFSMATTEIWYDNTGAKQERTEWHNISAFGKLAGACIKNIQKGCRVFVDGKITYKKVGDKYFTNIVAKNVTFIDFGSRENVPELPAMEPDNNNQAADDEYPF